MAARGEILMALDTLRPQRGGPEHLEAQTDDSPT